MAKRDFTKNNPALAYITTSEDAIQETYKEEPGQEKPAKKTTKTATKKTAAKRTTPGNPPKGYKVNPEYIELKSQRFNLLMQPTVLKRVKKLAKSRKLSTNETINQIIIEYLEREGF